MLRLQGTTAGELHVYANGGPGNLSEPLERFVAYTEVGYSPAPNRILLPPPPDVERVLSQCRPGTATDPRGAWLYLVARVVAELGRCVQALTPPCAVFVSYQGLFRLR